MELKKDLDEYLLLKSDQKKSFKLQMPNLPNANVKSWFNKETKLQDENWFEETKRGCCPSMSRMQRFVACGICIFMGILCFSLSAMYIPVLLFKARKFALLFTLGSLFFLLSFSFFWGPIAYIKHLFSREKIWLTIAYLTTLLATLYFALHLQSTSLTVLFAVGQVITLLWSTISSVPGGSSGASFFGKMFTRTVSSSLPI